MYGFRGGTATAATPFAAVARVAVSVGGITEEKAW